MIDPQTIIDLQLTPQQALGGTVSVTAFNDYGTILRASYASDSMGGSIATYTAHGTAICTISPQPSAAGEGILEGRMGEAHPWIVTFPQGTDILSSDRITSLGHTFEVTFVMAPMSLETSRRVRVIEAT